MRKFLWYFGTLILVGIAANSLLKHLSSTWQIIIGFALGIGYYFAFEYIWKRWEKHQKIIHLLLERYEKADVFLSKITDLAIARQYLTENHLQYEVYHAAHAIWGLHIAGRRFVWKNIKMGDYWCNPPANCYTTEDVRIAIKQRIRILKKYV